jgi:hypothetical protein
MKRRLTLVSALAVATACAHKPAAESPPGLADVAPSNCSQAAIDSLSGARRDSARIACNGYRFQVGPTPRKQ